MNTMNSFFNLTCCKPGINEFHFVERKKKFPEETLLPPALKLTDALKILKEIVLSASWYFEAEFYKGTCRKKILMIFFR